MDQDQTAAEAHEDLQASVNSWGKLLIASGGSLKPEKCFLYLTSFVWNSSGKWAYESNELKEEYRLGVPMPDGSLVEIDHLSVDIAKETLGVFTCPTGTKCLSSVDDSLPRGQSNFDLFEAYSRTGPTRLLMDT